MSEGQYFPFVTSLCNDLYLLTHQLSYTVVSSEARFADRFAIE